MEDNDFFGVNYASRTPIPPELLPNSAHSKAKKSSEESDFFDDAFFSSVQKNDRTVEKGIKKKGKTEEPPDDFFTESIKNNKDDGFFANEKVPTLMELIGDVEEASPLSGIKTIWQLIDPVWKFSHEELLSFMESQVIYETDDVIAFNKPYQMAYTGDSTSQAQFDRLLKDLKERLVPSAECLQPVSRLEKFSSGVVIFAKTLEKEKKLTKLLAENHGLFSYRTLVKNIPAEAMTRINIPLIKVEKNGDHKLCPLSGKAKHNEQLYHETTDIRLINENQRAKIALVDAFCKKNLANVVRSHLYYGINCPVVGDRKYMKREKEFSSTFHQLPRLSQTAMEALNLQKANDIRKLPMFMHLSEVHLPETNNGRFSIIRADLPKHFVYALKRLHLFRK